MAVYTVILMLNMKVVMVKELGNNMEIKLIPGMALVLIKISKVSKTCLQRC